MRRGGIISRKTSDCKGARDVFPSNASLREACASYLVGCPTREVCAAVDPQGDPEIYVSQVQTSGMVIESVIETHIHADQVPCARELAVLTNAPFYVGPGAAVRFPHLTLADGQVLDVGNRRIRALHSPGHTVEHVCLTFQTQNLPPLPSDFQAIKRRNLGV